MTVRKFFHESWSRVSRKKHPTQIWSLDPAENSRWECIVVGNEQSGWRWHAVWPNVVEISGAENDFWRALRDAEGACSGVPQRQSPRLP